MVVLTASLALWSIFIVQQITVLQQFLVCLPRLQVSMVYHHAAGVTRVLRTDWWLFTCCLNRELIVGVC